MGKLVMCGCHIGGKDIVETVLEKGYRFDYFVCLTPEQGEKHRVSGYYDYRPLAEAHGIPVYHPRKYSMKSEEDQQFFRDHTFDILIQGGWQRLFPEAVLNSLKVGALGYHGSSDFLPKGRGRSPMNWSIIEDKKRFIMHLFLMKAGADDGDIIDYEIFDITPYDDIETMYFKYSISNKRMILRNMDGLLQGDFDLIPQRGTPSYYPKRGQEDGRIDWEEMDVFQIQNLIRAVTRPYPGAFAEMDGKLHRIWKARLFDTRFTYPGKAYGEVVERFGEKWVVNCRGGLLLIDEKEEYEAKEA